MIGVLPNRHRRRGFKPRNPNNTVGAVYNRANRSLGQLALNKPFKANFKPPPEITPIYFFNVIKTRKPDYCKILTSSTSCTGCGLKS